MLFTWTTLLHGQSSNSSINLKVKPRNNHLTTDLLQALGVAPRTSEPTSPLQPKRDLANTEEDRNSKRRRVRLD